MKQPMLIAVSNQKGGVGKSTLTVLLASYLYYEKGYNLAVVDCDTLQHSLVSMRKRDMQTVEKSDYYKHLIISQYDRLQKKSYPIIESSTEQARESIERLLEFSADLDIILIDLPGNVISKGVFSTVINMDYVLTPIVADRMVMQSTLLFATSVLDYIKGRKDIPLKNFFFLWNKIDRRVNPEIYDAYNSVMEKLNLKVLETVIPESKRFDKELSISGNRVFFRSTLLPPPAKLLDGSNIDMLAGELCKLLKL